MKIKLSTNLKLQKKREKIMQKKPLILKSVYIQIKGMAWNGIYDHKYIILEKGEKKLCLFISFLFYRKKKTIIILLYQQFTNHVMSHSMATITTFVFELFNI